MLIQQHSPMTLKTRFVNKTLFGLTLTGAAFAGSFTANALPANVTVAKSIHKVKFSRADTATADGLAAVYAKLTDKASSACAFGRAVDTSGEILSKEECAADMMAQFLESAKIDALTEHHKMSTYSVKTASLASR